jgi:lipid II:glycine glycyltransferase (peptidoglycan interpeptide bridge formation enzyme)
MNIDLRQKDACTLLPTDILFQTVFWSKVKSQLGWEPHAFDLSSSEATGDILVLTRSYADRITAAYVPQGPEYGPDPDKYGPFLEELSDAIVGHIDRPVSFIRYDLPWESQYSIEDDYIEPGRLWAGRPEARLRELRMNFGTRSWNLRKSPIDLTVADTFIVDISESEEQILSRMKPKTRYNIRLAERRGVRVFEASAEMLPVFYDLYCQTADRNGFPACEYKYFSALFSAVTGKPDKSEVHFLLAALDGEMLAGAIIAISGRTAVYLFGASSNQNRSMMGPYAVQWEAIRTARAQHCITYDMGAVPPSYDTDHAFYGMYRFKAGFGGKIVHRSGSWDFPLDHEGYGRFRNAEALGAGLP